MSDLWSALNTLVMIKITHGCNTIKTQVLTMNVFLNERYSDNECVDIVCLHQAIDWWPLFHTWAHRPMSVTTLLIFLSTIIGLSSTTKRLPILNIRPATWPTCTSFSGCPNLRRHHRCSCGTDPPLSLVTAVGVLRVEHGVWDVLDMFDVCASDIGGCLVLVWTCLMYVPVT